MDTVGQPLRDVMERLNGALDRKEAWEHLEEEEEKKYNGCDRGPEPPAQQPFREDSGGEPPDPVPGETLATGLNFLQASPSPTDICCFTANSPDSAPTGGGHHDATEHSQSQTLSGCHEDEGEAKAPTGQELDIKEAEEENVQEEEMANNSLNVQTQQRLQEEELSPSESSHPAEFRYEVSSKWAVSVAVLSSVSNVLHCSSSGWTIITCFFWWSMYSERMRSSSSRWRQAQIFIFTHFERSYHSLGMWKCTACISMASFQMNSWMTNLSIAAQWWHELLAWLFKRNCLYKCCPFSHGLNQFCCHTCFDITVVWRLLLSGSVARLGFQFPFHSFYSGSYNISVWH